MVVGLRAFQYCQTRHSSFPLTQLFITVSFLQGGSFFKNSWQVSWSANNIVCDSSVFVPWRFSVCFKNTLGRVPFEFLRFTLNRILNVCNFPCWQVVSLSRYFFIHIALWLTLLLALFSACRHIFSKKDYDVQIFKWTLTEQKKMVVCFFFLLFIRHTCRMSITRSHLLLQPESPLWFLVSKFSPSPCLRADGSTNVRNAWLQRMMMRNGEDRMAYLLTRQLWPRATDLLTRFVFWLELFRSLALFVNIDLSTVNAIQWC